MSARKTTPARLRRAMLATLRAELRLWAADGIAADIARDQLAARLGWGDDVDKWDHATLQRASDAMAREIRALLKHVPRA